MSAKFETLLEEFNAAIELKRAEEKALDQRLYAKGLIEQELDERIAAKEAEFAHWRGKVDHIAEHCEKMFNHAHDTANYAINEVSRILGSWDKAAASK